jgi:hypothetical protein
MELFPDGIALATGLVGLPSLFAFKLHERQQAAAERAERQAAAARAERMHARELQAQVLTAPYQSPFPALTHYNGRELAAVDRAPGALADPVLVESSPAAPAFAALLAQGLIGPGRPLLLGYSADGPLVGGWKDLYSSAVAGLSGSGKTTTLRFLAAQSAAQGARFLILDPHADAGDESLAGTLAPLAPAFLAPPATDPRAMLRLLEQAHTIMQTRLAGGARPWPLIVAVDEFTALMGRSDLAGPLAELIEAIAQEGRKVQCFALISGQIFTAARSGSTALRDALASAYVHRMKRAQARLLIGTEDAARAEGLRAGQALLARANGDVIAVTIPDTTAADIGHVAALLTNAASPVSPPFPSASTPVSGEILQKRPSAPPETDPARVEAVREAVRAGMAQGKILEQLWAVKAGGGASYNAATEEFRTILAWLVTNPS